MANFIADENIAESVISALRKKGFSVLSIREEGFSTIADDKILQIAKRQKAIIITHDKDFGFLTRYLFIHPGIILIRLKIPHPQNVIQNLMPFLAQTKIAKLRGRITVIREGVIRII